MVPAEADDVLRVMLDSMMARVSYWDRNHQNRFANRAFLARLGVAQEAITGRHFREVFGEGFFARHEAVIAKA